MRRLVLLVALTIPLVGALFEHTPGAAACSGQGCKVAGCAFVARPPTVGVSPPGAQPGEIGLDCTFPLPEP